jgi:GDPmannose 4,6-dehydratase
MNKCAIITGVTGQDGAYLAKFLLENNYKVIGVVRNFKNGFDKKLEYLKINKNIQFEICNLLDKNDLLKLFDKNKPDEVYNLSAQSSISYSFQNPYETIEYNSQSVVNLLDLIKNNFKEVKLLQAVSSDIYSGNVIMPISEKSNILPTSPYGCSKAYAYWCVQHYRELHSIFCSNAILFNHESYLRGDDFFIKKIIKSAIQIKFNELDYLKLGNLDVKRDIGYAPEYVKAMWLILQSNYPEDFCVCSGNSISLRKIVEYVFDKLNISLKRILIDENLYRINENKEIYGDNSKIKKKLNWNYDKSFFSILDILIDEELINRNEW